MLQTSQGFQWLESGFILDLSNIFHDHLCFVKMAGNISSSDYVMADVEDTVCKDFYMFFDDKPRLLMSYRMNRTV